MKTQQTLEKEYVEEAYGNRAIRKTEQDPKLEFFRVFNKVQGTIAPIKADSTNPHFNSKYASLQAVMVAVAPFLEAGFSFHHEGTYVEGKWLLRTLMVRGNYETESCAPLVEDGNPQHFQSAQTYAKRGNILNLTGLALDVDDDANAATPAPKPAQARTPIPEARKAAQDATAPAGVQVVSGIVSAVTERIVASTGKPAWDIAIDGKKMSTLDESLANLAIESRDQERAVNVGYKAKGNYLNAFYIKWEKSGAAANAEAENEVEVPF